jgi:hypothetical protein
MWSVFEFVEKVKRGSFPKRTLDFSQKLTFNLGLDPAVRCRSLGLGTRGDRRGTSDETEEGSIRANSTAPCSIRRCMVPKSRI